MQDGGGSGVISNCCDVLHVYVPPLRAFTVWVSQPSVQKGVLFRSYILALPFLVRLKTKHYKSDELRIYMGYKTQWGSASKVIPIHCCFSNPTDHVIIFKKGVCHVLQ